MEVGQKVVCVDDSHQRNNSTIIEHIDSVIKGEIYTIREIKQETGGLYLKALLAGYHFSGREAAFDRKRFRLVDYTFGENIEEFIDELILTP